MIAITCDKCERPFDVADDEAGGRVQCPYCGDINRVPPIDGEPGSEPVNAPKPAAVMRPARDEPEQMLRVVRQAMFRAHPFWYMLLVLSFGIGLGMAIVAPTMPQGTPWIMWTGIAIAAAAAGWWLVWWAAPHRWIKLTITSRRTIRQEGIVMRKTSEVLHDHIRNIRIEQSVLQRLLGVGAISIDSAGGSDAEPIEIQMQHVVDPYGVKQTIDAHRQL